MKYSGEYISSGKSLHDRLILIPSHTDGRLREYNHHHLDMNNRRLLFSILQFVLDITLAAFKISRETKTEPLYVLPKKSLTEQPGLLDV